MLQFFLTTNWTTDYGNDKDFFDYKLDELHELFITAEYADDGDFLTTNLTNLTNFLTADYTDYGDF